METASIIVGFVVAATTLLGVFAAGVWAVAAIRTTTDGLRVSIDRLTAAVERLDEKSDGHAERITRLEMNRREMMKS